MKNPTVTIPAQLLSDLIDVAEWYGALDRDVRAIAPEYMQRHPDPGAVDYLAGEANGVAEQARAYREQVYALIFGA